MNASDPRPELRSGIFFFGLSLFVIGESLRLNLGTLKMPGSGFVSFCAGIALFSLSLALIYSGRGMRVPLKPHARRVIIALLSLFVYSLVLESLGFIIATFFLIGILFRLGESRRWWVIVGLSALVTLLAYGMFGVLLSVYLPLGLLGI